MIRIGGADDRSCILDDQKRTNNATEQKEVNRLSVGFDGTGKLADFGWSI